MSHLKMYFARYVWRHPSSTRVVQPHRSWRIPIYGPETDKNAASTGLFFYPADSWVKTHAMATGRLGTASERLSKLRVQISRGIMGPSSDTRELLTWGHGPGFTVTQRLLAGVESGHVVNLELVGVGYKAEVIDDKVSLRLGFANSIELPLEEKTGVRYNVVEPQLLQVYGLSYQDVHQAAATVRALRKPEPYKGKGIRYQRENVYRKAAKKDK